MELLEQELLLSGGYPQGSYPAEPLFGAASSSDWEKILIGFRGDARRALEFLPQEAST